MRAIAFAAGNAVKAPSEQYIAKRLLAELNADASPAAIRHELGKIRSEVPQHFWNREDRLNYANKKTAMEKLECANANSFADREHERIAAERAKPKIILSEIELKLPPEIRLSLIHEREAAAIAANEAAKKAAP